MEYINGQSLEYPELNGEAPQPNPVQSFMDRVRGLAAREVGMQGYLIIGAIFFLLLVLCAYFFGDPIHSMTGPD